MEEEKNKNSKKIWKIIFKVLIIFCTFEIISQILGSIIAREFWKTLVNGKYSIFFVFEATILFFSLIFLFLQKKWYIFKNAKKDFFSSIKLGGPILIFSLIFFFFNCTGILRENIKYSNLFSLILYTSAIGLFEEVFYRGIIQEEIVENYSSNRKELIISLLISSFIFGLVHLTNAFYGQTLFQTLIQVLQTSALGLILGIVYYLTKNIWAVAFLHGFYDFSIMLSDVNLYKDCIYTNNIPNSDMIVSLTLSIVLVLIYLLYSYSLLQKSKVNPLLNEEVSIDQLSNDKRITNKLNKCYIILVILIIIISAFEDREFIDDYYICYNYNEKKINNFETHYYNYDNFNINTITSTGETFNLNISLENNKITFKNNIIDIAKNISYEENIISLVVYEYNNSYQILILATDYINYKIYYSDFMTQENINNNQEYLDNIISSFKVYDIPDANTIGYLKDYETGIIYPMIKTIIQDIFVIDDNNVYVVK